MSAKKRISAALAYPLVKRLIVENLAAAQDAYVTGLLCSMAIAATTRRIGLDHEGHGQHHLCRTERRAYGVSAHAIIGIFLVKGIAALTARPSPRGRFAGPIVSDLQNRQFSRMLRFDIGRFANQHPAKFVSKIMFNRAPGRASFSPSQTAPSRCADPDCFGMLMVKQDPVMSLISVAVLPSCPVGGRITRKLRALARGETELAAQVQSIGTEAIEGIRTIVLPARGQGGRQLRKGRSARWKSAASRSTHIGHDEPVDGGRRRRDHRPFRHLCQLADPRQRQTPGEFMAS